MGSQGKVAIGLLVLGSGNPLIWGGAWYANRQRKAMAAQWENQKRIEKLNKKKEQQSTNKKNA